MKLWKRIAAAFLIAVMGLMALAACSSSKGGLVVTWENSRTKKSMEENGITGNEFTIRAKVEGSEEKTQVVYVRKGDRYYLESSLLPGVSKVVKDENGDIYGYSDREQQWYKWKKGSDEAKEMEDFCTYLKIRLTPPTKQAVISVSGGMTYELNQQSYDAENIQTHENGMYMSRMFLYDGDQLKYILINGGNTLSDIELSGTAEEALLKAPEKYASGSSGGHAASSVAASSAAASGSMAEPW